MAVVESQPGRGLRGATSAGLLGAAGGGGGGGECEARASFSLGLFSGPRGRAGSWSHGCRHERGGQRGAVPPGPPFSEASPASPWGAEPSERAGPGSGVLVG